MTAAEHGHLLKWFDDLSVGINELDGHHKEMVNLVNKLYRAVNSNLGTESITEIVAELMDYANYHFGAEEALFELKQFPEAFSHSEKHLEYREHLAEFRDAIQAGDKSAVPQLMEFLFSWWTRHILECDKKYTPFLKD